MIFLANVSFSRILNRRGRESEVLPTYRAVSHSEIRGARWDGVAADLMHPRPGRAPATVGEPHSGPTSQWVPTSAQWFRISSETGAAQPLQYQHCQHLLGKTYTPDLDPWVRVNSVYCGCTESGELSEMDIIGVEAF